MNDKLNFKAITDRFAAETPTFWKKIQKIALVASGIAGSILMLPVAGVAVPAALITGATYVFVVGGTIAGTAQATVK